MDNQESAEHSLFSTGNIDYKLNKKDAPDLDITQVHLYIFIPVFVLSQTHPEHRPGWGGQFPAVHSKPGLMVC